MTHPASHRDSIRTLADAFLTRYRRGERPTVSDYTPRHPDLADEIRDLFPALLLLQEGGSPDPTVPQPAPCRGVSATTPFSASWASVQTIGHPTDCPGRRPSPSGHRSIPPPFPAERQAWSVTRPWPCSPPVTIGR